MKLTIAMCEHDVVPAAPQERKAVVLDLADFLVSAMMDEKERPPRWSDSPKPTAQEMEAVNGLFRHFLFKRCGKGEIWTTCCRRHTFVKPDTDNADELRVLHAPHTPEPWNGWDHSPAVKRRCSCPYCGAEVTVKELRYSGGRPTCGASGGRSSCGSGGAPQ